MQSPSLEPAYDSHSHIYVSGDVVIHPSAAIAPGVLLQADPGCRLTVADGVCIGQGGVLHAHRGNLTIDSGTMLGRAVLILGQGKIGANACIGAFSTILNSSVAAGQILPPNSLLGETGRQVQLEPVEPPAASTFPAADSLPDPWVAEPTPTPAPNFKAGFIGGFSSGFNNGFSNPSNSANGATPGATPTEASASPEPQHPSTYHPANAVSTPPAVPMSTPKPPTQVYGQAYVERIMIAMFPHRRLTQQQLEGSTNSSTNGSTDGSTDDSIPPNPPP